MDLKAIVLLAVAGYFVWRQFDQAGGSADQSGTTQTASPSAPAATPSSSSTAAAPASSAPTLSTPAMMAAIAKTDKLNWWQWNWYFNQVRGFFVPDSAVAAKVPDPAKLFTVDEWWSIVSSSGVQ